MDNYKDIAIYFTDLNIKEEIIDFLNKLDLLFLIKLSEKVDIREYIEKVLSNRKILISMYKNTFVGVNIFYANDNSTQKDYISTIIVDENFKSKDIGTFLI